MTCCFVKWTDTWWSNGPLISFDHWERNATVLWCQCAGWLPCSFAKDLHPAHACTGKNWNTRQFHCQPAHSVQKLNWTEKRTNQFRKRSLPSVRSQKTTTFFRTNYSQTIQHAHSPWLRLYARCSCIPPALRIGGIPFLATDHSVLHMQESQ